VWSFPPLLSRLPTRSTIAASRSQPRALFIRQPFGISLPPPHDFVYVPRLMARIIGLKAQARYHMRLRSTRSYRVVYDPPLLVARLDPRQRRPFLLPFEEER